MGYIVKHPKAPKDSIKVRKVGKRRKGGPMSAAQRRALQIAVRAAALARKRRAKLKPTKKRRKKKAK